MTEIFKTIETLLYIQGDKGITPGDIKDVMDIPTLNARKQLQLFMTEFNSLDRGLMIVEFNNVYKMATKEKYKEIISKLVIVTKKQKLSNSAIETVGIIAYKQPITKTQINKIRGVSSEGTVNTLLLKGLIEERGVAKTPGSPVFYGISNKFYDYFKIKSLKELPKISDFDESTENNFELFSSQRQDFNA